jgi:hypothetical protein
MTAASVKRPMRRTIFLALFAALLLVPTAAHAAGPIQIIRDCEDDGVLQGDYTPTELRKAQTQLPTDIDEYSDCRDVLSREISARASASNGGGGGGGTGAGTGTGADAGTGGTADPAATPAPPVAGTTTSTGKDPGVVTGPATPEDWAALAATVARGDDAVMRNGHAVSPGSQRLAASVGRNGLPVNLIVVLVLLGAVALAATLPFIRRRVVGRPSA